MNNELYFVVVEQGIARVVPFDVLEKIERDPYFDGEVYGAYTSYEQAANQANQFNL
jgi:hypothetical protein